MVRLGLFLPVYGGWFRDLAEAEAPPTYDYVRRVAREAERLGFDSLWIPDHLLNPLKGEAAPSLEAWTLAAAVAEATERVTIAHTTLCEAFRHPAVLAKQAATLAEISGGRFWLSLGAGWYQREFEAYGLPFLAHDERIARTREAMEIVRRLWERDGVDYRGEHYALRGGTLAPRPDPPPRLWYAGMSPASRALAAELADGWLMASAPVAAARANVAEMRDRCAAAGRKAGRAAMEFAIPALTFIRDSDAEAEAVVERLTAGRERVRDETLATGLVGSPATVARRIRELAEAGIDHVLLQLTPTLPELARAAEVVAAVGE